MTLHPTSTLTETTWVMMFMACLRLGQCRGLAADAGIVQVDICPDHPYSKHMNV